MNPPVSTSSVAEALSAATDAIAAAGSDTARLDAELLLCTATGWDRAQVAADPALRLPVGSSRVFSEMVRRRIRREPVAYILGRKGFRRLELLVDRRVLIPRPESELLVDVALELAPKALIDVGTGSGAIALAIADELPDVRVTGIDTSLDALRVAQANCDRLGLADRVDFVSGGVSSMPNDRFDLLVANLPYVSDAEWGSLQPEIREYEPRDALVAGPTGLEVIEALLANLGGQEPKVGAIALEVGAAQAESTSGLMRAAGYDEMETRDDLAGIARVVVGR
jgi:release factor glutamine methyltransferase